MADLTNAQKKEWAKTLYMRENLTQQEIAERVGVSRVTVSNWVRAGKWEEQKAGLTLTRQEQVANLYRQVAEINRAISARAEGGTVPEFQRSRHSRQAVGRHSEHGTGNRNSRYHQRAHLLHRVAAAPRPRQGQRTDKTGGRLYQGQTINGRLMKQIDRTALLDWEKFKEDIDRARRWTVPCPPPTGRNTAGISKGIRWSGSSSSFRTMPSMSSPISETGHTAHHRTRRMVRGAFVEPGAGQVYPSPCSSSCSSRSPGGRRTSS